MDSFKRGLGEEKCKLEEDLEEDKRIYR